MKSNPLINAILEGNIKDVRDLVRNNPELLSIRSKVGSLPYKIAVNKGLANQTTVLLKANACGSENFNDYQGLLTQYISDISHDFVCASWLSGIEFKLWEIIFENQLIKDDYLGLNELDEETKGDLRFLSQKCNGWIMWSEEKGCTIFVSLEKWKSIWRKSLYKKM